MKQTGILFSTAMVMAILEGRKTQTRRVVKANIPLGNWDETQKKCPYGAPGDMLYVRETFYAWGKWVANGTTKTGKQKWKFMDLTKSVNGTYLYCNDKIDKMGIAPNTLKDGKAHWYKRPSMFMPKAAVRLFLQVDNIRVERLSGISEADAMAEGVIYDEDIFKNRVYKDYSDKDPDAGVDTAIISYRTLWQKINGTQSWNSNPWVWVVEFKKIGKPNDWK